MTKNEPIRLKFKMLEGQCEITITHRTPKNKIRKTIAYIADGDWLEITDEGAGK